MDTKVPRTRKIAPTRARHALDPQWNWDRHIPAPGHVSVDFERRVDFDRLRAYRLGRAREALKNSQCGALLLFDVNNIRYVSGTKIGEWERDKLCRFALLAGDEEPIVWDFGSAAVHHKFYCDWLLPENCRAGMLGMRGTVPPSVGLMKNHAEEIMGAAAPGRRGGHAGRRGSRGNRDALRAAEGRDERRRRPAGHARRARDQEPRRDHPA